MARRNVVIGLVGSTLNAGVTDKRWSRWRPSVAVCQQADFRVDRFELLMQPETRKLADQVAADITHVSPATELRQHVIELANPWDFSEVYESLDGFAESYPWRPGEDYYLHITTGTHVVQICLFLLRETRAMPAVLLQSSPMSRTPDGGRTTSGRIDIIDLELAQVRPAGRALPGPPARAASPCSSPASTRATRPSTGWSPSSSTWPVDSRHPLLLTGETGTGKTVLCHRIYELKRARQHLAGEMVAVNCATLRGDIAMSVLFGHVKGAFTGAAEARTGLLRKADRGLLFLDEIGELGRDEQAMLLTAIEERRFYPLGADQPVTSDFQLIAGTNRDLAADVRAGRFRDDLLARLALWTFRIPALRERPEDIAPNLDYELDRVSGELGLRVSFAEAGARRLPALRRVRAAGRPTSATSTPRSAAWPRWPTAAASRQPAWPRRLSVSRPARGRRRPAIAWPSCSARRPRRWIASIGCSWPTWWRCARRRRRSRPPVAPCSRSLAQRTTRNDADRLRKYLARFGADFETIQSRLSSRA